MDDFVANVLKIEASWEGLGDLSNVQVVPLGTNAEAVAAEEAAIAALSRTDEERPRGRTMYRPPIRLEPKHSYAYISREALYLQVWSLPMTRLSQLYGLSDNGLRKTCRRYNIPVPRLGEWAKLKSGHFVKRPGLPPLVHDGSVIVRIRVSGSPVDDDVTE
jgi:hypothetical protein